VAIFEELWDFDRPAVSEERFRAALADSDGEEAHLLRTQLARSLGLQGRFDECAGELDVVAADVVGDPSSATPLVRSYLSLERGRMHRSSDRVADAVPLFLEALEEAQAAGLDHVAADAAHMMALVADPDSQIEWAERALAIAQASTDPDARNWIGSVENNLGWTYHELGRHEEALAHFERALTANLERGDPERIRIARWTVASGLRQLGRYEEALSIQYALLAQGPEDGYVHEELGELFQALGRPEEAEPHARRAREMLGGQAG
jgi:tetratricopeptide (TPR) repeat protein